MDNNDGDNLIDLLPELRHQLLRDLMPREGQLGAWKRLVALQSQLEILPYTIGGAWRALVGFANQMGAIEAKYAVILLKQGAQQVLQSEDSAPLGFYLDAFLDNSRRSQNGVVPYLRRAFPKLTLRKSLSDVCSKVKAGKLEFGKKVNVELVTYWDNFGSQLRLYRDLTQHYTIIFSDALVFNGESGFGLFLTLPNNPQKDGRPSYWDRESSDIHAFPWMIRQFSALVAFAGRLADCLIDPYTKPRPRFLFAGSRGGVRIGRLTGYTIPKPETLLSGITAMIRRIRSEGWECAVDASETT